MITLLPFVGRDLELAVLRETCAGGGTALVMGPSGIGKSRLLAELRDEPATTVLIAAATEDFSASPYAIFRTLAIQLQRLLDPASLDWGRHERAALGFVFPRLASTTDPEEPGATNSGRRETLWNAMLRYLAEVADTTEDRLVLVFEDLHLADEDSLRLLGWLAAQDLGLAVLGSVGPQPPQAITRLVAIELRPLGIGELERLLDEIDGGGTDAVTLHRLTEGVPNALDHWWRERSVAAHPLTHAAGDADSAARAALGEPIGVGHVALPLAADHRCIKQLRIARSLAPDTALDVELGLVELIQRHRLVDTPSYQQAVDRLATSAHEVVDQAQQQILRGLIVAARHGTHRSAVDGPEIDDDFDRLLDQTPASSPYALAVVDVAVGHACRFGRLDRAERLLRRFEEETGPTSALARWNLLRLRSGLAYARGAIEPARALAIEALHLGTGRRFDEVALDHFGLQLVTFLRERRKLLDARPTIETWVTAYPDHALFRALHALVGAELGDFAKARSDLEVFFARELEDLRDRADGLAAIGAAITAAFLLGADAEPSWVERGHLVLGERRDEWLLLGGGSIVHGPVVQAMALASAGFGDVEGALAEVAEASERAHAAGALLHGWHAMRDRGLILERAGRFGEASEALGAASDRYRAAGLHRAAAALLTRSRELAARVRTRDASPKTTAATRGPVESPNPLPDNRRPEGEFRRENERWRVGLGNEEATIRDLKGMAMLHALLQAPGREIAAATLAAIADGNADPAMLAALRSDSQQPLVDDAAVAAYRRRLDEIIEALDRADRRGDAESSADLTAEFDAIVAELKAAHGIGGRRRIMTDVDERARVRVNKAIRTSMRHIEDQAPLLAAHLLRSIDTGVSCRYRSDPLHEVLWRT